MKKIFIIILFTIFTISLNGGERSHSWSKIRNRFVKSHPFCEICGTAKSIQVHHIKPFHLYPQYELEAENLVTVCTSKYWGFNCHLSIAHGGRTNYENPWIMEDIAKMKVIASPQYIRKNGTDDRDKYLKFIARRVKNYNQNSKKAVAKNL